MTYRDTIVSKKFTILLFFKNLWFKKYYLYNISKAFDIKSLFTKFAFIYVNKFIKIQKLESQNFLDPVLAKP